MILILHGPRTTLRDRLARHAGPNPLVIPGDPELKAPWTGARQLLAGLRQRRGDAAVAAAVAPRRAALAVTLRRLEAALTTEEQAQRSLASAQEIGFLSHANTLMSPQRNAWVATLRELLRGDRRTIVVPDATAIDLLSLSALRRLPGDGVTLVVGVPTDAPVPEGLWWRDREALAVLLSFLAAQPGARVDPADDGSDAAPEGAAEALAGPALDPLDDASERRALDTLRGGTGPLAADETARVLDAMAAAFAGFGFTTVLHLGLAWLDREPVLPGAVAARVHTLIALAAYNRQIEKLDTPWLAAFIGEHLAKALAAETNPAARSHLYYRLSINDGRRRGDLAAGIAAAERALEAAAEPGIPRDLAAYLEAWARNGRAFLWACQRRFDAALADCTRALALLGEAAGGERAPRGEMLQARLVLLDNLAQIHELAGDVDAAATWQREITRFEEAHPELTPVSPHRWVRLHRARSRWDEAIRAAARARDVGREYYSPLTEDLALAMLGDLHHRVGDAEAAHAAFAALASLRERLAALEDRRRAETSVAVAALRGRRHAEAHARFVALADAANGPGARAELLARAAVAAARGGDVAGADEAGNAAIDAAVASGARATLARVAGCVSEAAAALGRDDDARDAAAQALALVREGASVSPVDRFYALLVALEAGLVPPTEQAAVVAEVLAAAPAALEDGDAWWELPRLARWVDALAPSLTDASVREAAARVADAAAARTDAAALRDRLRAALA